MKPIHVFAASLLLSLPLTPAFAEVPLTTTRVASGLSQPLYVTAPPGDTSRLFILEQGSGGTARIKILNLGPNTVNATPFLTITGISTGGERGLLGLAFHPNYATNGFFYVYVSATAASNAVRRYSVMGGNPDLADPSSMQPVLTMADPFSNHNGGWMGFGPDGYLYVATGDGGSGNDPNGNGQNINSLLGKMLRLDIDGDDFPVDPNANYANPPTNPFVGVAGSDEIWHYGLRNPWRNGFDRATGELYIADVGQNAWEEVDVAPAGVGGLNFGWRCMEGNHCTGLTGCTCMAASLTDPIQEYAHGSGCSITGGYVYRGTALCGLQGTYFYADYCSNAIWSLRYSGGVVSSFQTRTAQLAPGGGLSISSITSFGEDANGEMYIVDQGGEVFKIVPGALVDCNQNSIQDACDIENATSQDTNANGIPDECEPDVDLFCFGDGSSGPCPCGNTGTTGNGCQNSAGTGGAHLAFTGSADLSSDSFTMTVSGELPSAFTIFLQGDVEIPATVFGDGLRCAGGHLYRLYSKNASGGSAMAPDGLEPTVSSRSSSLGDTILPGETRLYHTYYRDPSPTFCPDPTGKTFNSSSGLRVRWVL